MAKSEKKKKRFINTPTYPGGKAAFNKFIKANLKYPEKAIEHAIEGFVFVEFWVDSNGNVVKSVVTKGLGYGCDEEALRVISLLKYNPAKNRGLLVTSKIKTRIFFKPPNVFKLTGDSTVNYHNVSTKKPEKAAEEKKQANTYTYSIRFNK